jgi:hypothetical protein
MATSANSAPGDGVEGVLLPAPSFSLVRPTILCLVFGALAMAVTIPMHRWALGVFIFVGLAIGLANAVLVLAAVTRITSSETPSKQKMALSSASRLLVITAVALVIGFAVRPNGIGLFFGLAVFQVIQVLNTTLPVLKGLRQQS